MNRPADISFLTPEENQCFECLLQAQDLFDKICENSPQSPTDSYNFGHYLDAARSAILLRGARRLDSVNLLTKHRTTETVLDREKNTTSEPVDNDAKPADSTTDAALSTSISEIREAVCETIPNCLKNIQETIINMSRSMGAGTPNRYI